MPLVVKDRVKQFSVTSGTGTLTLGATPSGFQSFSSIGDGNTTYYAIVNGSTGDWEVGIGTYTASGTTLSRDSVLASSNSGNLVNFNSDSKEVFVVYSAEKAVFTDVIQTITNKTISGADNTITNVNLATGVTGTLPIGNGGTGQTTATAAFNALAPSQTGNSGRYLTTDGTNTSWANVPAPNNGTLTLGVSGTGLSGSATFTADQAGNSTFTVTSNATSANTNSTIVARDASGNFSAGTITAALSGNATTATTLATGRTISMTGDVSYTSGSFNGSANVTGTATLANSGVTAGSYTLANITVDAKGRITTASSGVAPSPIPAGTRTFFAQAAAPTGWTRDTSDTADNRMLRIISSGAGGGVGGTHSPILNNVVPSHTHSFTTGNQSADHTHSGTTSTIGDHQHVVRGGGGLGAFGQNVPFAPASGFDNNRNGLSNGAGSHSHTITTGGVSANHTHSGTTDNGSSQTNWQPRYVDVILCTKD